MSQISEKTAFLLLYVISIATAIAVFFYCTRVKGLTVDDFPFVAAPTVLIPATIAVIGSIIILKLKLK